MRDSEALLPLHSQRKARVGRLSQLAPAAWTGLQQKTIAVYNPFALEAAAMKYPGRMEINLVFYRWIQIVARRHHNSSGGQQLGQLCTPKVCQRLLWMLYGWAKA